MREQILSIIRSVHENKKKLKLYPYHVLYSEITNAININNLDIKTSELKKELNAMVKEKIIIFGKTVHEVYFNLKKEKDE